MKILTWSWSLRPKGYVINSNFGIKEFEGVVVDPTVLAASLEDDDPPGLLLAEALVGLGPMVLP